MAQRAKQQKRSRYAIHCKTKRMHDDIQNECDGGHKSTSSTSGVLFVILVSFPIFLLMENSYVARGRLCVSSSHLFPIWMSRDAVFLLLYYFFSSILLWFWSGNWECFLCTAFLVFFIAFVLLLTVNALYLCRDCDMTIVNSGQIGLTNPQLQYFIGKQHTMHTSKHRRNCKWN